MEGLNGPIAHANKLKFYWKETSLVTVTLMVLF